MSKKIYHLANCGTCQDILKQVKNKEKFELINIKEHNITPEDLDYVAKQLGSYEAVFSKKAMKYRSLGLNNMTLTEQDYRNYILEEYTFLKRPVSIIDNEVVAGNTKASVEKLLSLTNG
jgi:arsenate reductase (glutaredoxin)